MSRQATFCEHPYGHGGKCVPADGGKEDRTRIPPHWCDGDRRVHGSCVCPCEMCRITRSISLSDPVAPSKHDGTDRPEQR